MSVRASRWSVLAAAMLAAACASQPATPAGAPASQAPPPPNIAGECNAAAAQFAVGQPYSAPLGEQIRSRAGARTLRVIRPGQVVTLEFSSERVQVDLDAQERVARVRCG